MKRAVLLSMAVLVLFIATACSSGGGKSPAASTAPPQNDPLYLLSPNSNITISRGDIIPLVATMPNPQLFEWVEFYFDLDRMWDNGNESLGAFGLPAADFTADWDTVSASPGVYNVAIVIYTSESRVIGYADFTVTVEGEEMFDLLSPSDDVTLQRGDDLYISGTINSTGFTAAEFYLDPDVSWGNGNEILIATFPHDDIDGNWSSADAEVGTYYFVVVLYRTIDRFIGYTGYTVTVEPQTLPTKQIQFLKQTQYAPPKAIIWFKEP